MVTVNEATTKPTTDEPTSSTPETPRALDLVFLQDATGSQSPYINAARDGIAKICQKIIQSQRIDADKLRFGLIAFRDYEPQDYTMVAKDYGFTDNIETIRNHLSALRAMGGGDGPEAQAAAMSKALNMPWREDAMKVVVLITDAPPHGIGEAGDFFPQGSPDRQDPLNITRQMAQRGIVLHVIACEPTLSQQYSYASEFYQAIVDLTGGRMLPLLSADSLPDYILGASIETAALEGLIKSHASDIDAELSSRSVSAEEYAENLYKQFNQQGVKVDSLEVPDSYVNSRENTKNITTWMGAMSLQEAKGKIAPSTTSRLQQASMPGPSSSSPGHFASSIGSLPFGSKRMRTGPMFGGMPPPAVLTAPSMPIAHATPAVPLPASSVTSMGIQQEQVLRMVRQVQARSSPADFGSKA